jgi:hypothetical protein
VKPVDQLTKLERLREVVALQRLSAASGFDNVHKTDLDFLRRPHRINPTVYMFRDRGGYEGMIEHYLADAQQEYDKLKLHWSGDDAAFRQLVREKGLSNVVNYRLERRKNG